MKELTAVRAELYSRAYQVGALKRGKGEVGKLKNLPSGEAIGILRNFGRPTRVITHKSANSGLADFEYTSPRNPLPFFVPMRLYLPYGAWTESDVSEVWFSRDYFPLWRFKTDCAPERADPREWIKYESQKHFWGRQTPWSNKELFDHLVDMIDQQSIRSLPRLVESLTTILDNDRIDDFSDVFRNEKKQAA